VLAIVVLAMAIALAASAQDHQEKPSVSPGGEKLTSHLVKTGLYLIAGGGGNSLLRFSANGSILVDGKLPGNYRALMSQVRRISKMSDLPVRVLIVTDHHDNHTGNNAQFLAAGIPIIAQENAKRNFSSDKADGATAAAPTVTYDRDYALRLGGVEVLLKHFGRAHTNGDTVVYFPNLKVVAVGHLFTPGTPEPDFSRGGSLVNWGPVLARILELDFDVVVPSTGPMVTRTDLEAFRARIDALASRAIAVVGKGVPKEQLMAELKTDDLGWRLSFTGEQLDRFYTELSEAK
jgi:glyoxylase-like metal-dependent hydrolase (beta-lactamase superfamily II)